MTRIIKPHKKTRSNCRKCQLPHSENEHRFHTRGAYYETHVTAKRKIKKKLSLNIEY